jgi:hypothetical protein
MSRAFVGQFSQFAQFRSNPIKAFCGPIKIKTASFSQSFAQKAAHDFVLSGWEKSRPAEAEVRCTKLSETDRKSME